MKSSAQKHHEESKSIPAIAATVSINGHDVRLEIHTKGADKAKLEELARWTRDLENRLRGESSTPAAAPVSEPVSPANTPINRGTRILLVERINALPNVSRISPEIALQVIAIFRGVSRSMFDKIDNEIGNAHRDYKRGHLVRQVRNHPEYGRALSAALAKR